MSRPFRLLGFGLLGCVALYPVWAWTLGLLIEHHLQQQEALYLANAPMLRVVSRHYQRGVYAANEEVTYALAAPIAPLFHLLPTSADSAAATLQFTVRSRIHHGPLPAWQVFAPASVDSELLLPEPLQTLLAPWLHGQSLLQSHWRIGWLGGSAGELHSPAMAGTLSDGSAVDWRGVRMEWTASRHANEITANAEAPLLTIDGTHGRISLESVRLESVNRRAFGPVYTGTARISVKHLGVTSTAGDLALDGLELGSQSAAHGEYLDSGGQLRAATLQFRDWHLMQLDYEMALSHLHGPSLAALTATLQDAQRAAVMASQGPAGDPPSAGVPWSAPQVRAALVQYGEQLLVRAPVMTLPHMDFVTPDGQLRISARAAIPDVTLPELQRSLPAAVAQHLDVALDLSIDEPLLYRLAPAGLAPDALTAQVRGLESRGYLVRTGTLLQSHLRYRLGQTFVNGQRLDPAALAASPAGAAPRGAPQSGPPQRGSAGRPPP